MSIKEHGLRQLYVGAGAFCVANTSKSAVRFLSFDIAKGMLSNDPNTKKVSPTSNMLAGMVAGTAEGLLVVTPGETLKTKLVDDRAGPKAYHSTTHAIRTILSSEGPAGLYRGVLPVTLKQSANAMVRFTSYNFLLDYLHLVSQSGAVPALAGAVAGIVTVYATMPFDSIKTRMQAIGGHKLYQSTWHCARSVVHAEGVQSLWMGTTPRLVRLSVGQPILTYYFVAFEVSVSRTDRNLRADFRCDIFQCLRVCYRADKIKSLVWESENFNTGNRLMSSQSNVKTLPLQHVQDIVLGGYMCRRFGVI